MQGQRLINNNTQHQIYFQKKKEEPPKPGLKQQNQLNTIKQLILKWTFWVNGFHFIDYIIKRK